MTPEELLNKNELISQLREQGLVDETTAGKMRRVLLTDYFGSDAALDEAIADGMTTNPTSDVCPSCGRHWTNTGACPDDWHLAAERRRTEKAYSAKGESE